MPCLISSAMLTKRTPSTRMLGSAMVCNLGDPLLTCPLHAPAEMILYTLSLASVSRTTASTTKPNHESRKQQVRMSRSASSSLATRRAKQRWSAMVSAPNSRLAGCMHDTLGPVFWEDFVRHANRNYKAAHVQAFKQQPLRCVACTDGTPCRRAFEVDNYV